MRKSLKLNHNEKTIMRNEFNIAETLLRVSLKAIELHNTKPPQRIKGRGVFLENKTHRKTISLSCHLFPFLLQEEPPRVSKKSL